MKTYNFSLKWFRINEMRNSDNISVFYQTRSFKISGERGLQIYSHLDW